MGIHLASLRLCCIYGSAQVTLCLGRLALNKGKEGVIYPDFPLDLSRGEAFKPSFGTQDGGFSESRSTHLHSHI